VPFFFTTATHDLQHAFADVPLFRDAPKLKWVQKLAFDLAARPAQQDVAIPNARTGATGVRRHIPDNDSVFDLRKADRAMQDDTSSANEAGCVATRNSVHRVPPYR
jgi:hypothetical protein